MLDFHTARNLILQEMSPKKTPPKAMPLLDCLHRYLAEDVFAQFHSPAFSNSAMDGFALSFSPQAFPEKFQIVGRIMAGDTTQAGTLQHGQAIRLFTGAPIPENCVAIVAQEHVNVKDNFVYCLKKVEKGENIRRMGEEFMPNQLLLQQGKRLEPAALGLAASQGYHHLNIHSPLTVTIFSTGDELLDLHQSMQNGKIYDANRYQLMAWLAFLGCTVRDGGILQDDLQQTIAQLGTAAQCSDMVLTSGGVSVGEADFLKAAIAQLGTLTHWKLSIKPGKPFAWGYVEGTPLMMLPGNCVAAFVTFKMLVEPVIRARMGAHVADLTSSVHHAKADFSWQIQGDRREFLRGFFWQQAQGELRVRPLPHQGSHMLSSCAQANCLIEIPANTTHSVDDLLVIHPL